jgi:hypothetical protein
MTKKNSQERLQKIKISLSQKDGIIDQNLKDEIRSFMDDKKKSQQDNLLNEGTCSDLDGLTQQGASKSGQTKDCKDPIEDLLKVEPPQVFKDAIKRTISSMLDPLKMTFVTEVAKYTDAISTQEKINKKISRTKNASDVKKLENGRFTSAAGSENDKIVNPEFKQLLSTGYKPDDARVYQEWINAGSVDGGLSSNIGIPEYDYIKNINNEFITNKFETIETTVNNIGGAFIKPFNNLTNNVSFNNTNLYQEIVLNGYSAEDAEAKKFKATTNDSTNPNWKISYKEAGTKYYLNIDNNFEYFTNNGTTKDTSSCYFVGELTTSSLTQEALNLYNQLNTEDCNVLDNAELYGQLMSSVFNQDIFEPQRNLPNTQQLRQQFKSIYTSKYSNIFNNFINSFFSSYENNRLLKDFKQQIPGLGSQKTNLKIINLLNFIPQVTQELIDCGKQPHPLNLDLVIDLMTKKFNSSESEDPCNEEQKEPISKAAEIGSTLMFLRLCIFENCLKTLFILDESQYSPQLSSSELLVNFIYIKTIEELKKFNFLEDVENIVQENYEFFKENLQIEDEDNTTSGIEKIVVNKEKFETSSSEMYNLLKNIIQRNLGFLKNLIGISAENQEQNIQNLLLEKVSKSVIYNVTNDQFLDLSLNNSSVQYINYSRRFENRSQETESEFMCLEKYILANQSGGPFKIENIPQSIRERYKHVSVIVNINLYEKFLKDVLSDTELQLPENTPLISGSLALTKLDYFIKPPKIGLRIVQNSLKTSEKWNEVRDKLRDIEQETDEQKRLKEQNKNMSRSIVGGGALPPLKIDQRKIKYLKLYGFYDIDLNKNEINFYNSVPIVKSEINLTFKQLLRNNNTEIRNLNNLFNNNLKQELLENLSNDPKLQLILKKCFFLDKLPNLALFYSHSALSNSLMNNMFNSSKKRIYSFYESAMNVKNYSYKNETERSGGIAKKFQNDFNNIGDPTGGSNPDVLQFLLTTPILILKGLTQIMDPNIAIASQIVDAASAGLLFPKFDAQGNPQYPGNKIILPTVLASLALLPVNIFAPLGIPAPGPPVTPLPGMLYWALEPLLWKLPYYQNLAANSEDAKNLINDPANKGLKIGNPTNFSCDKDQDQ